MTKTNIRGTQNGWIETIKINWKLLNSYLEAIKMNIHPARKQKKSKF